MGQLEVTATGRMSTYQRTSRSLLVGEADVALSVSLAGVVYSVRVNVWDLEETVAGSVRLPAHEIEMGGRVYASADHSDPPAPVAAAFIAALAGVEAWMGACGVVGADVRHWAVKRAEADKAAEKKQARASRRAA